jgi:phospholipid transport system substrate-binding protein
MNMRMKTTPAPAVRRGSVSLVLVGAALLVGAAPLASAAPAPAAAKARKKATPAADGSATAPAAEKGPATPPADSSPMAELKRANAALKKSFGARKPSWSPEAEAKNAEVKKIVGDFLDFEELARRALGKNWEPQPPPKRAEFVKTLRDLAERNYVRQFYGQPDYDLKLDKEEKAGSEATVSGSLLAASKGKKVTMELQYKLLYKGGHWVVYDVITDDLSLLENYRAEFNKIIAKESFDALLGRMKKKLHEKAND